MIKKISMLVLSALLLLNYGCKPKDEAGTLVLNLTHNVDGTNLAFNSFDYTAPAGYPYEVTNLEYYISNITVEGADGILYQSDDIYYVDASDASTLEISLPEVLFGQIQRVRVTVGLDADHNTTGSLPNTTVNNNMAWPDMMGGGYHFLKFEGNYTDTSGTSQGFAMHIGKTGNHSDNVRTLDVKFDEDGQTLNLPMNVNEWLKNPHLYDWEVDGAFSMHIDAALVKLSENGEDVFE